MFLSVEGLDLDMPDVHWCESSEYDGYRFALAVTSIDDWITSVADCTCMGQSGEWIRTQYAFCAGELCPVRVQTGTESVGTLRGLDYSVSRELWVRWGICPEPVISGRTDPTPREIQKEDIELGTLPWEDDDDGGVAAEDEGGDDDPTGGDPPVSMTDEEVETFLEGELNL